MDVICKQQFKQGKHFILPREIAQAVYALHSKRVSIYVRGAKIAEIPKGEFDKYFDEYGRR